MPAPNWFVLTGGPATGKTTLQLELQKKDYVIVPEIPRTVIDEALASGITARELRKDEEAFQNIVVTRRISVEASLNPAQKIILDRGTMDTVAYLRYYGFPLSDELLEACKQANYAKVFLLDPLTIYRPDYARTEDAKFATDIQQLLYDAYDEYGFTPIKVPALPIAERTAFVVRQITSSS